MLFISKQKPDLSYTSQLKIIIGIKEIISLADKAMSIQEAIKNAEELMEKAGEKIGKVCATLK